jgi:hypothetical protein
MCLDRCQWTGELVHTRFGVSARVSEYDDTMLYCLEGNPLLDQDVDPSQWREGRKALYVKRPIHMNKTIPGKPEKSPGLYATLSCPPDVVEAGVLEVIELVLVGNDVCCNEAVAIPVRVMGPLVPEIVVVVLLGVVEVVVVVVLLGVVDVVVIVPVPISDVDDDIVSEDTGRGGPIDICN